MSGRFLAVEGIDGCGKTGVVRGLAEHLRAGGAEVVATREPGGTPQGEAIRALLLAGADDAWHPHAELLLMTAARVEHVQRVILPGLARGAWVVSDRYAASTLAYQGAGRGISEDVIRALHRDMAADLWPDLTIVLDLDAETALARSRQRLGAAVLDEGRFEGLGLDFQRRIGQSFRQQALAEPARYVVVDASGPPEAVLRRVVLAVEGWPF